MSAFRSPSRTDETADPRSLPAVRRPPFDLWSRGFTRLAGHIGAGQLSCVFANGHQTTFAAPDRPKPQAVLKINRTRALRRLLLNGDAGFAEAYMDGDWDSPDLAQLFELALDNESAVGSRFQAGAIRRAFDRIGHFRRRNTRRGSRRNIAYHYDLSNAFYRLWLGETMSYSSALFESPDQSLADAQAAKNRQLAEMLALRPGHHVLEIGCGWGGFALAAAKDHGCRVTAITLSTAQCEYARARVHEAGLDDRIEVRIQDYRDVDGRFDRIASVEMFEAVGERYWPTFFEVLRDRLTPGGIAALQIITIDDGRYEGYRASPDYIQQYIFPGGMLPSPSLFRRHAERAGFALSAASTFGASYARTLALWRREFQHAWAEIESLGFDRRFKRMWEYYLAYCEAGFRAGSIDVGQYRLEPR